MKINRKVFNKENAKGLPQTPGVYIFWNKSTPIYVGKAINLKRRVGSYLNINLNPKTKRMVKEASEFSTVKVNSDLEAMLLEARLVYKHQPKYNISLKDDKNPLYIVITKEKYPRVVTARKRDETIKNILFIGPFPSSRNVRIVLKLIRKIIPYSDHKLGKRGCIYSQIGLCNPCPNDIESIINHKERSFIQKEYKNNIRLLKMFFLGKLKSVRNELVKEMNILSKNEKYEKAKIINEQITNLDYITQPITPTSSFIKNPNLASEIREVEKISLHKIIAPYFTLLKNIKRIECYDIAHISGTFTTSSMVTFIDGEPDKKLYRHFRIRQKKGSSDTDSLREVAQRRERHLENWGKPDLIIVDGGKGQVSVFDRVFNKYSIPVVGIAKSTESLIVPIVEDEKKGFKQFKLKRGPSLFLIQRLRNESHRFARRYHHKLVSKDLFKPPEKH